MTGDPHDRPCKFDGEPIIYDASQNAWTRDHESGDGYVFQQYGRHTGPCGRQWVLLRQTRGEPPFQREVSAQ